MQMQMISVGQYFITLHVRKITFASWCNNGIKKNTCASHVFMKHYHAPSGKKVWKSYCKVSQGHKVIDLGVIWKGINSVEYACQIWSLYLLLFKSYSEG